MILHTDGTIEKLQDNSLKALQEAVHGYIECVALPDIGGGARPVVMVVNEEGKLLGLEANPIATMVMQYDVGIPDVIVGDAVFVAQDEDGELDMLYIDEEDMLTQMLTAHVIRSAIR